MEIGRGHARGEWGRRDDRLVRLAKSLKVREQRLYPSGEELPIDRVPSYWYHAWKGERQGRIHAHGLFADCGEVGETGGGGGVDGGEGGDVLVEFFAELGEDVGVAEEVVRRTGEGGGCCFAAGNAVTAEKMHGQCQVRGLEDEECLCRGRVG